MMTSKDFQRWSEQGDIYLNLPDPDMNESDMPLPVPKIERCPICGGLNPGDMSHTRCM